MQMFNGASVNLSLVTPPITDWRFFACVMGGGVVPAVYDLTKNVNNIGATPSTNTLGAMLKIIGSHTSAIGTNNNACDIAFFASYTVCLTKPQIDAIYASVRQSLALRGITV
jgi:hypothetical protein